MKKILFIFLILYCASAKADYWTQKANYGGGHVYECTGFSILNKGYIGLGYDFTMNFRNDFWEYDPASNSWTQKASFPSNPRSRATGFSIGNKGYIGGGTIFTASYNDFWEYDPALNSWTQKINIGNGTPGGGGFGFAIGNKGYIGCTGSSYLEFWEYDPALNLWSQKANVPGIIGVAACYSINNKGYVARKLSNFEYDATSDTWTLKSPMPLSLDGTTGFSIGNRGFAGTGLNSMTFYKNFYEYDPLTDTWIQKTNFAGAARAVATGFSIGNQGYLGTGGTSGGGQFSDFWEYTPDSTTGITDFPNGKNKGLTLHTFPNPNHGEFRVTIPVEFVHDKNLTLQIFDNTGKLLKQTKVEMQQEKIKVNLEEEAKGVYNVTLSNGKKSYNGKIVFE